MFSNRYWIDFTLKISLEKGRNETNTKRVHGEKLLQYLLSDVRSSCVCSRWKGGQGRGRS